MAPADLGRGREGQWLSGAGRKWRRLTASTFALPPAVTALGFLLLGVVVLIRERASHISTALLFVHLAVSLWLCGLTAMYCAIAFPGLPEVG